MKSNTTAGSNTAVGKDSLCVNQTGGFTVAVGQSALRNNTASNNTAVGADAMILNSSGSNNVAVGKFAMNCNTTGANNSALGCGALAANTTASNNTAMGYNSLLANTTGANNAAMGCNALLSNTTANENTAIGHTALNANTTGCQNTAVGSLAGYEISTGNNNLLLGKNAGRADSPSGSLTTQSNQVVLGNDSITDLWCADTSISSSDLRDKTDIEDFTHGLDFVTKLNPKTYRWDKRSWYVTGDESVLDVTPDGSKKKNKKHIGFLAQDVLALEKEIGFANDRDDMLVVNQTEDETRYGLKYERLVPVLVNAIKELKTQNEDLKSRIEVLENS